MSGNEEIEDIWTLIALLGHKRHAHRQEEQADRIESLLRTGADPDQGREAPLLLAARMGYLRIARILLDHGADVHGRSTLRTPLLAAGSRQEMRELLLARGARETPFSLLTLGDDGGMRELVEADGEWVHATDEADKTLLFYAAGKHDVDSMTFLLDSGADPNAVAAASYGVTPIHEVCCARHRGGEGPITVLKERGANLDAANKGGVTALHMAVRVRNVEAVRTLLKLGAAVDPEDRGRKSTPLRRAVAHTGRSGTSGKEEEVLEIVKLLLDHGADPRHRNRTGREVVDSTRNAAIRQLLEAA